MMDVGGGCHLFQASVFLGRASLGVKIIRGIRSEHCDKIPS